MTAKIACPCAVNWFHSYLKQTDRQTDKQTNGNALPLLNGMAHNNAHGTLTRNRCQKLVLPVFDASDMQFGTKFFWQRIGCVSFSCRFMVPVFWYEFLVLISGMCVTGIRYVVPKENKRTSISWSQLLKISSRKPICSPRRIVSGASTVMKKLRVVSCCTQDAQPPIHYLHTVYSLQRQPVTLLYMGSTSGVAWWHLPPCALHPASQLSEWWCCVSSSCFQLLWGKPNIRLKFLGYVMCQHCSVQ